MAVIRVNKTDNYTIMSNWHLRDKTLSLKAKGLLSQMLSLPPNWDYTINGLVAINSEKKSAITSALKELREHGYLVVTKKMPNETASGRIEYIYDIFEEPFMIPRTEIQDSETQETEKQGIENQYLENRTQLNTNELNTDELKTEKKEKKKDSFASIVIGFTPNKKLQCTLYDFIEMRRLIKKPLVTERALHLLLTKLNGIAEDDETQIKILEQSIMNNWQSVYPLKSDSGQVGANGIKIKPESERDHTLDGIL